MPDQSIDLRSVYNLRVDDTGQPIRYRIPAYQRGFRWTGRQVEQLLEDIREFVHRENPQPEDFYCLQPLVLLPHDDGTYEVVDGLQRLTTLLLILQHFNARLTERFRQTLYVLEYETRPGLEKFLEDPTEDQANSNIDFFHINQAITTIEEWFGQRDSEVETIKDALLNKAKLIWYELSANENPVDAFTELVKKPKDLVEYVVVHEMVHLLEPTHSERFVALLGEHFPTWREARAELNALR